MDLSHWDVVVHFTIEEAAALMAGIEPSEAVTVREKAASAEAPDEVDASPQLQQLILFENLMLGSLRLHIENAVSLRDVVAPPAVSQADHLAQLARSTVTCEACGMTWAQFPPYIHRCATREDLAEWIDREGLSSRYDFGLPVDDLVVPTDTVHDASTSPGLQKIEVVFTRLRTILRAGKKISRPECPSATGEELMAVLGGAERFGLTSLHCKKTGYPWMQWACTKSGGPGGRPQPLFCPLLVMIGLSERPEGSELKVPGLIAYLLKEHFQKVFTAYLNVDLSDLDS